MVNRLKREKFIYNIILSIIKGCDMIEKERPKRTFKALQIRIGGLFYLLLIIMAIYIPYKTMVVIFDPYDPSLIEKGFLWFFGVVLYGIIFGIGYAVYANWKEIMAEFQSIGKKVLRQNDKKD